VKPARRRELVQFLRVGFRVSERRACRVIPIARASHRYQSQARDQSALRLRLRDLAQSRVRYGYRRLHVLLQREGWQVNHKRVYRLYHLEGLSLRLKTRKKRVNGLRGPKPVATQPNECWSRDFMADRLVDGRRFRVLTLVDNVSRVSPAIVVDSSLTGERVVEALERLAADGMRPQMLSIDNGPEFISRALDAWAHRHGVQLEFSRPGKPTDNAFIEAFNSRFRDECLNLHWFESLEEARTTIEAWRVEYNTERPHGALGQQTPAAFSRAWRASVETAAD
jgi:putative transposase